ncbi:MAG: type II toxin-antitoxin system Phd/YefM family antitoxin [Dokdonella sp.]
MQINLYEAKTRLSELVEAAHQGKTITIGKSGRPLARLVPLEKRGSSVRLGLMKGEIRIGADFDAPLPDDVLADFYGSDSNGADQK